MPDRKPRPIRRAADAATKLVLAGLLLLLAAGGAAHAAQTPRPGITLGIAPASQSVSRGQPAIYSVSLASTGGLAGTLVLSATGLPAGASAAFAPASVAVAAGGKATATLTVSTSSTTPVGSSTISVTASSGKVTGTVTAGLTVNYPLSGSLSMTATPASVTMGPGATAVYAMTLLRTNVTGPVAFAVYGGLPSGATALFTPTQTTGNSTTLQVSTTVAVQDGTYALYVVASGADRSGVTRYAYASVQLVVSTTGSPFTISGYLSGRLAPGSSLPLNLTLSNPNRKPLSVTNLTVTVQAVTRTPAAIALNLPCPPANYAVTQYSGPYPLVVSGNGSASLSGLGIQSSAWPHVAMFDTTTNQDGCKGAVLTLAYSGSGQGN